MTITFDPPLAHALRFLSIDAVEKAKSGHPGMPMGMAEIMTVLWQQFLKHNPINPKWINRDRFILSNGHGSMLHYAALHLSGYNVSLDDLKQFRQLHSKTPGHPEYNQTPGIETTTGPLGQGLANAVGMALAEKALAAQFNQPDFLLINHFTYVFVGDGCLMEGISHEACSLAGTLELGKLIAFWDNNGISIDGKVRDWFSESIPQRFEAYGWQVISDIDGHDPEAINKAIQAAQSMTDKPSLLCCKTHIGFGSPHFTDSHKAHGAPLGEEEIKLIRQQLNWPYPPFSVPEFIYKAWDARDRGQHQEMEWNQQWKTYQSTYPALAKELVRRLDKKLPMRWTETLHTITREALSQEKPLATRKASQQALNQLGPLLPELFGGSADLTESNGTSWAGSCPFSEKNLSGNYLHYGVREFGMTAIMNGIALHGGFIPYGGTFLTFSDYARPAIRLAAMMKLRVIFVLTHDSIGLGEDGPTHQPIEQLNSLRLIPNLTVWRPCDTIETFIAWQEMIEHQAPSCLVLTRQNVPQQPHTLEQLDSIAKGAYILWESNKTLQAILIATGSEVSIAMEAAISLQEKNIAVRVVSMPSMERFLDQTVEYQEHILPKAITKRIVIEAGNKDLWHRFVHDHAMIIGLNQFGASAPGSTLFSHFGITAEAVITAVMGMLK